MKIDDCIVMLKLPSTVPGMFIYPTVMWDEDNMVLVDVGYGGQSKALKECLIYEGIDFDDINRIIITHQDLDHFGALSEILDTSNHPIEIMAHDADKPYIQGEKTFGKVEFKFS